MTGCDVRGGGIVAITLRVMLETILTRSVRATIALTPAATLFILLTFLPSPLAAQTREELRKTPLAPAVEKQLADFVQQTIAPKTEELNNHMSNVIAAIDASAGLTAAEKAALDAAAGVAVAAAMETWRPAVTEKLRPVLAPLDADAVGRYLQRARAVDISIHTLVHGCTLPDELPLWTETLKTVLGADRFAAWHTIAADKRAKEKQAIAAHLARWAERGRKSVDAALATQIDTMADVLGFSDARTAALREKAGAFTDRLAAGELARVTEMFHFVTNDRLASRLGGKGANEPFEAPRPATDAPEWRAIVEASLDAKEAAAWQNHLAEESAQRERLFTVILESSYERTRVELEALMKAEISHLTLVLDLPEARQRELKTLSDKAMDASRKNVSAEWLKNLRQMDAPQLEVMKQQGGAYFAVDEAHQPINQPAWKDGLEKLLTSDEKNRVLRENDLRNERRVVALGRLMLAELDAKIAFTADQRKKLEPILLEAATAMPDVSRSGHFSSSPNQFFEVAGRVNPATIEAILDDLQQDRWETLCIPQRNGTDASANAPDPLAKKPAAGPAPAPAEPPDIESALSRHLYEKTLAERRTMLESMTVRVEDAARVLSLPPDTVAELHTAAKGAVEEELVNWKGNMERWTRSAITGATRQNIEKLLAGHRTGYRIPSSGPQAREIWTSTLDRLLTRPQKEEWKAQVQAREQYHAEAIAAFSLTMLDLRRRLTTGQVGKLQPLVSRIVTDYQTDIRRFLSSNWYFQSYYSCLPLAGIPEKDVKAILSPAQWDACQEQELPQALMYWGNIKENHDRRMKDGGANPPEEFIFFP